MCLPLVRFDLSEYQEAHAISKLIGSPPGYVGYQEGGQLLAALRKHPACVLLLDEFDKAHPALAKLFLQGLDYGTMTDNQGEVINLRQSYVILTSNQGVQYQTTSKSIGFIASSSTQVDMQQLKESLAPEFRNRLDAIVPFKSLDLMHMGAVVSKALAQLQKRLDGRITLMYDTVFCEHVARVASQADMGARPIARWVDEHLRFPIAERLLEQNPPHGSLLSLTWCSDSNKPLFTDFALQHQAEKVTIND
jgi:ATP-dependent Clp protease ATP-binding subunit ClpA